MSQVMTAETEQLEMPITAAVRPPRKRVRADSLPEFTRYRDDGCDVNPSCLTCPLPRCRYEEPGGLRALLNEFRDRQIIQLRRKGLPVEELAVRFGVSRRTVFRVLESTGRGRRAGFDAGAVQAFARLHNERKEANCA